MAIYHFHGFTLSTDPLRLERNGEKVALRAQAARLLVLLVSRSRQTVTHEEIRHAIWADRNVDFAKAIPLLIGDIRKALGESSADPALIETLPREGYRFVGTLDAASTGEPARFSRHWAAPAGIAAMAVVSALAVWIGSFSLPPAAPGDSAAETLLVKGDYALRSTRTGRLDAAERYYRDALSLDKGYKPALAGLAEVLVQKGAYDDALEYARAAGKDARADLVRAMASAARDWNWPDSLSHVEQSLKTDPTYAEAWAMKAMLMTVLGDIDAALAASEEAYRLEPVSALVRIDHGWFYYYASEFESALAICSEGLSLEPESWSAAYCQFKAAAALDDDIALDAANRIYHLWENDDSKQKFDSISAFDIWHHDKLLKEVEEGAPLLEALAAAKLRIGDDAAATDLLRRAAEQKSRSLPLTLRDPAFSHILEDVDISALIQKSG